MVHVDAAAAPRAPGAAPGHVALDRLARLGWIGEATWIALEIGAREDRELRAFEIVAERKTGKAKILLLRLAR